MRMTVGQLRELLEEFEDDVEVRFVGQPSWPMEYSIMGAVSKSDLALDDEDVDEVHDEEDEVLYLVEGSQLGYASKRAWELV